VQIYRVWSWAVPVEGRRRKCGARRAGARANAANRRDAATARPAAATTGDEDETEEDNRPPATTAPATKRAGNKTQQPGTETAANERRPGPANAQRPYRPEEALSHFFLRELLQGGRAAWQRWTRRITRDARQPEGVNSLILSFPKRSGRAHSNGCSRRASRGVKGRLARLLHRDCART